MCLIDFPKGMLDSSDLVMCEADAHSCMEKCIKADDFHVAQRCSRTSKLGHPRPVDGWKGTNGRR